MNCIVLWPVWPPRSIKCNYNSLHFIVHGGHTGHKTVTNAGYLHRPGGLWMGFKSHKTVLAGCTSHGCHVTAEHDRKPQPSASKHMQGVYMQHTVHCLIKHCLVQAMCCVLCITYCKSNAHKLHGWGILEWKQSSGRYMGSNPRNTSLVGDTTFFVFFQCLVQLLRTWPNVNECNLP
jgi:hypothetical protein